MRIAAVAGHFGRDVERGLAKVEAIIADAHAKGVDLLVLPDATLGGSLTDLHDPTSDLPPALTEDSAPLRRIAWLAGSMTVCLGYTELADDVRHNTAICVSGDGVLGRHRKVHLPAGEAAAIRPGDGFRAFDTAVGRLGLLVDHDKTFPESARALALDGAEVVACLSAWPASVTDRASSLPNDRQSRLFDLYDSARAAENQVVWVSSNQTGVMGRLRFLGQAKVVGPGGEPLARSANKGAMVLADVDVVAEIARSRRVLHHLKELDPTSYTAPVGPR